jgi:undecaprenyl-diphosphatase
LDPLINALLKGILEGLTEFLPISSTGHLVLVRDLLPLTSGASDAEVKRLNDLFDIVVQFPAVLAIVLLYRRRLWESVRGLREQPAARTFWFGLAVAFLPAALVGLAFHHQIEEHLFTPTVIACALIVGGVVLLYADRRSGGERVVKAEDTPLSRALGIGLCQCLALIPGTSRSGATIIGARFLGLTREAAAEYSFFLALPTMFAAFVYKFAKAWPQIQWASDGPVLLVGGIAAFLTAWVVVAIFIRFLQKHTLSVFGWYRIALGLVVLWWVRN